MVEPRTGENFDGDFSPAPLRGGNSTRVHGSSAVARSAAGRWRGPPFLADEEYLAVATRESST